MGERGLSVDIVASIQTHVKSNGLFTAETAEGAEMNGLNELTNEIIGVAIEVHRTLGPGLLESTYIRMLVARAD